MHRQPDVPSTDSISVQPNIRKPSCFSCAFTVASTFAGREVPKRFDERC
jgi:hypothetical protein